MLDRSIPLWALCLILILGLCGAVGFGWTVRHQTLEDREGLVVKVADLPGTILSALTQIKQMATGEDRYLLRSVEWPEGLDLGGYSPLPVAEGVEVEGLMVLRPDGPQAPAPVWRVLSGTYALDGKVTNALLLLSPDLTVMRALPVVEQGIDGPRGTRPGPEHTKIIHGFEVLPDGSMIVAFDGGRTLQRIDACGRRIWSKAGWYSHSVNLDADGDSVWVVRSEGFGQVSVETGELLRQISIHDVIAANPETDLFTLRQVHDNAVAANPRNTQGAWGEDPFHFNDVDPLPAELEAAFPGFEPGDLLISARSLNLVAVIDPDTLAVKWWRIGTQQRQHDPDWLPNGQIRVYNNRMSRDYSTLLDIDPGTLSARTVLDGRDHDFYSRIRGKQQTLEDGRILVSSPQQGRVFEWDPAAGVVFDLRNVKPSGRDRLYVMTEMRALPPDYFPAGLPGCGT